MLDVSAGFNRDFGQSLEIRVIGRHDDVYVLGAAHYPPGSSCQASDHHEVDVCGDETTK